MNKVLFICVDYNGINYTVDFIKSIQNLNPVSESINIECIVVNNSTNENNSILLCSLERVYKFVKILEPQKNLGYFGAFNFAFNFVEMSSYKFIILCNNDLKFEPDFIANLMSLQISDKIFAISPDVYVREDYHQNPQLIEKISRIHLLKLDIYFSNYFIAYFLTFILKIFRPKKTSRFDYKTSRPIRRGIGACYILTSNFILNFNSLYYPTFLYSEEAYFSDQIYSNNGVIQYEPTLKVLHNDNSTLSKIPRRFTYELERISYWKSRFTFLKNYHNTDN